MSANLMSLVKNENAYGKFGGDGLMMKHLPYDRRVSYLRSDGHQFCRIIDGFQGELHVPFIKFSIEKTYTTSFQKFIAGRYNDALAWRNGEITAFYPSSSIAVSNPVIGEIYEISSVFTHGSNEKAPMFAFCAADSNSATSAEYGLCECSIYEMRISRGGVEIMHMIPVVKDEEGFLYDEYSNKMFRNLGSGRFTWGEIGE